MFVFYSVGLRNEKRLKAYAQPNGCQVPRSDFVQMLRAKKYKGEPGELSNPISFRSF